MYTTDSPRYIVLDHRGMNMRSLKEYNPRPMTSKVTRPNPSMEANGFRNIALKSAVIGLGLGLFASLFI
jgi:hypothetical protein